MQGGRGFNSQRWNQGIFIQRNTRHNVHFYIAYAYVISLSLTIPRVLRSLNPNSTGRRRCYQCTRSHYPYPSGQGGARTRASAAQSAQQNALKIDGRASAIVKISVAEGGGAGGHIILLHWQISCTAAPDENEMISVLSLSSRPNDR